MRYRKLQLDAHCITWVTNKTWVTDLNDKIRAASVLFGWIANPDGIPYDLGLVHGVRFIAK